MNWWYVAAFLWIAVSFSVASLIGRAIRFGMTGKVSLPSKPSESEAALPIDFVAAE